jgi:hypothetical protein
MGKSDTSEAPAGYQIMRLFSNLHSAWVDWDLVADLTDWDEKLLGDMRQLLELMLDDVREEVALVERVGAQKVRRTRRQASVQSVKETTILPDGEQTKEAR